MANTRELRRRIKSIKNTSQITKAMQMVAATKMRKAQTWALLSRSYSLNLNSALKKLLPRIKVEEHSLLRANSSEVTGIILLTTDKGLAGSINSNLFRSTQNFLKDRKKVSFITVGKKGRNFIVRTGKDLHADFENPEIVSIRVAEQITNLVLPLFEQAEQSELFLIYPHFVSTLTQVPRIVKLLPVEVTTDSFGEIAETKEDYIHEFIFEPNADDLLDYVLIHSIKTRIYQALLESKASEHSARMIAMQNATDNAKELVEDLTLSYNQLRQETITKEILEIATAGAAME